MRNIAYSRQVNKALGFAKLPAQGFAARHITLGGIALQVWCDPLPMVHPTNAHGAPMRRFALRLMCACPTCGKACPVGRLAQHAKVHG